MSYEDSNIEVNDFFSSLDIKKLPYQLQELIDIIGLEEAYVFSKLFFGQCKYIPKSPGFFLLKYKWRFNSQAMQGIWWFKQ